MIDLKNQGMFKTKHEGIGITVMFTEDYARLKGVSKYKVKQKVQRFELHELTIAGRNRMKSLIVVNYDTFKLFETRIVSDSHGMFKVFDGNKFVNAMFVDQYAEKNGFNSKQTIEYQLKKGIIKGVRIQRLNGEFVNLVLCEN